MSLTATKDNFRPTLRDKDKGHGERILQALRAHPRAPEGRGEQVWLIRELKAQRGYEVSRTTVSRWLESTVMPSPEAMEHLSAVLNVPVVYLAYGHLPDQTDAERKARGIAVEGALNLVAGFLAVAGAKPTFPKDNRDYDVGAVIKAHNYRFRVALASQHGEYLRFRLPLKIEDDVICIGVVPKGAFSVDLVELSPEMVAKHGKQDGVQIEVSMKPAERGLYASRGETWRRIVNFQERI